MTKNKEQQRLEKIHQQIQAFPTSPGVYFMKNSADKVLYIGKAKNLRSRLASYFQKSADLASTRGPIIVELINQVQTVDYLQTESDVEAMLTEARLIKDIHPPYNTDLVDDKTFPYLEITTSEDFPGVYITRKPQIKGSRLFGPFASAKDLRQVLVVLQKIFKFRSCRLDIKADDSKRKFFRPCLLYSINQCTAPCGEKIDKPAYKKIIKDLIRFLRSKRSVILRQLKEQMAQASEKKEYEQAAILRDRIRLIERLDRRGTPDENVQPEVFATEPTEALEQLQKILQTPQPIRIIEGIDIAHIAGTDTVGSLVKFIDGKPFKAGYRRFKIKTAGKSDDYAAIAEVVSRRYKHAVQSEELWPDLILIDGGPGQLNAAITALKNMNAAENVKIASISKKEELIHLPDRDKPVKLPSNSPARRLLQYVRDEAHRFAQHYHHILRSKSMLNKTPKK